MKTSEIHLDIQLDENKLPETIHWHATDAGIESKKTCKSFLLAIWDAAQKNTLRMDLWTKDMPLDEMKRFFFETLVTMADTYSRATSDEKTAQALRDFSNKFGQMAEVLQK